MDIDAQAARMLIVGGAAVGLGGIAAIITLARGGRKPQKTRERLLTGMLRPGDLTDDGEGGLKIMGDDGSLKPFGGDHVASPGVQSVYDDFVARSGERTTGKHPALAAPFGGSEIPPPHDRTTRAPVEADDDARDVLIPENYDKAKGRRHHVRPAPRSHMPWAVWNGRAHVRDYTRRYNAIAAAYRLNAAIGVD